MRTIPIILVLALFAAGCTTTITMPVGTEVEPRTIMLSEMVAELGWTYESGPGAYDYTARSPQGDQVIFRIDSDLVNINGGRYRQERDSFEKQGRDLMLPESTFNFVCKHFGRHELVRDVRRADTVYELEPITPTVTDTPAPKATPKAVAKGSSLKTLTICIDPGHGAEMLGGVGFGVHEKDVVLSVSLMLRDLCEAEGATVIMTRTTDINPALGDRCDIANNGKADLFISVHANIAPNSDEVTGIEAFYNKNSTRGKAFTEAVIAALDAATNTPNRGAKKDPRELRVLEKTKMPASLVELGFLSNEGEAKLLGTKAYQEKCAKALFDGIVEYWTKGKSSVSK